MCEKARSILTRRGVKARDFVDLYLITKEGMAALEEHDDGIIQKTRFMLQRYHRFRRNFSEKMSLLESGEFFEWGEEKDLLITELDDASFYKFVAELGSFLKTAGGKVTH